jgi:cytochrome c biogenesis protein CcdA
MRFVLLVLVVAFTTLIGALTVQDMVHQHSVSWLDVLSILIVVLFGTGIVGALLHKPRE